MKEIRVEDYRVVKFNEVYSADNIMPNNDECWKTFNDYIQGSEKVIIDCRGIFLVKPYRNEEFKRFLRNHSGVVLKIYNDEVLCNSINTMCQLASLSERALYEKLWISAEKIDPEVIKFNNSVKEVEGLVVSNGECASLAVSSYVGSIGSRKTLKIIKEASRQYIEYNKPREFCIDAGSLVITPYLVDELIAIIAELNIGETNVVFKSNDKELCDNIEMKKTFRKVEDVSKEERYNLFNSLNKDFPCMLIRYKDSRGKDEFGRIGRGEIISCRAAIIRKVTKDKVFMDTFDGDQFMPYIHWALENDNNVPNELPVIKVSMELKDVGFSNSFLGEKYHVVRAIQEEKEDMFTVYEINENGNATGREVCIPERMKLVFDSWDIEYFTDELEQCIEESMRILN